MLKVEYSHEETQGHENLVVGGEQFPHKIDVNQNMHRIYSHPLCPYAEKARLVFRAIGIKHQIVHVDMSNKPDWFVELGGTVPIVETPSGELIPESDIVIDYAMSIAEGGHSLVPSDPIEKAKLKLYLKKLDEGFLRAMFMGLLQGKEEDINTVETKLKQVEEDLSKNDAENKFLFNQRDISLVDIHISPILRRLFFIFEEKLGNLSSFNIEDYPHVQSYLDHITTLPDLAPAYGCKWGYLNLLKKKESDPSAKLNYPFDETPFEDSQSQKELRISNGLTDKPRRNEKFIRLYGHHLCPFVVRTFLALTAKKIPYQFVGIDLTNKNKWHLDINNGLVPILEHPDGTIVHDSLDVCDWIEEYSKEGVELYPGDEENKQKIKDTIQTWFNKVVYFVVIAVKKEAREAPTTPFVEALEWANSQLPDTDGEIYINGEAHETMADLMVLPFIHLAFKIEDTQLKEKFYDAIDLDKIKKIKAWYDNLAAKYKDDLAEGRAFSSWLDKNIAADGPKVQLFYPLY